MALSFLAGAGPDPFAGEEVRPPPCPLHHYAEAGDAPALAAELERRRAKAAARRERLRQQQALWHSFGAGGNGAGDAAGEDDGEFPGLAAAGGAGDASEESEEDEDDSDDEDGAGRGLGLDRRDNWGVTPAQAACMAGQAACLRVLLEAGAQTSGPAALCEGNPLLHCAVSAAAVPGRAAGAHTCVEALLELHPGMAAAQDDYRRTALHLAAQLPGDAAPGGAGTLRLLARRAAAWEGRAALQVRSRAGETALHAAAQSRQPEAVEALLAVDAAPPLRVPREEGEGGGGGAPAEEPGPLALVKDLRGNTALHAACAAGCARSVGLLLQAAPGLAQKQNARGQTPPDVAALHGHFHLRDVPFFEGSGACFDRHAGAPDSRGLKGTLLVRHDLCEAHHSCPPGHLRRGGGGDPPPENARRLEVLTGEDGILTTTPFRADGFQWEHDPPPAAMADVLKVHNWPYVRKVLGACDALPDAADVQGHLDGDTAVSKHSFRAALIAAGSVTMAIDRVVAGEHRNAFCATRPPGHHAGPSGKVDIPGQPGSGSHGFCLLANAAIGAAYALDVHRRTVKRVAIIDFDVHHGNGTEACIKAAMPHTLEAAFSTPFSEGRQAFPVWKPWLGDADADSIFFATVQGYGEVMPGTGHTFYPGTGRTGDTRPPDYDSELELAGDADAFGGGGGEPEHVYTRAARPRRGPRIVNVGIPGPGGQRALWRRAWRDKCLPALAAHDPDLIIVSAGFDAHRKDDMNSGFMGLLEADFQWVTGELVKVANSCCGGRIVSVLEGGYRLNGGLVSAFARSVAAHVRALGERTAASYAIDDVKWERNQERLKAEAKRQALEADRARMRQAFAAEAAAPGANGNGAGNGAAHPAPNGGATAPEPALEPAPEPAKRPAEPAPEPAAAAAAGAGAPRSKRARKAVDYEALNKQLEAEAAAKKEEQQRP